MKGKINYFIFSFLVLLSSAFTLQEARAQQESELDLVHPTPFETGERVLLFAIDKIMATPAKPLEWAIPFTKEEADYFNQKKKHHLQYLVNKRCVFWAMQTKGDSLSIRNWSLKMHASGRGTDGLRLAHLTGFQADSLRFFRLSYGARDSLQKLNSIVADPAYRFSLRLSKRKHSAIVSPLMRKQEVTFVAVKVKLRETMCVRPLRFTDTGVLTQPRPLFTLAQVDKELFDFDRLVVQVLKFQPMNKEELELYFGKGASGKRKRSNAFRELR